MKTHTNTFKNNIKLFGRQINSKITYELEGDTIELGPEDLNSVTSRYEGNILKSVMKQLDVDTNVEIPIGTIINYQFGLKVGEEEIDDDLVAVYEWLDFGNYIVNKSEKQEDTRSWKLTCYDKILYSMKDFETIGEYSLTEDEEFVENKKYFEINEQDEYVLYEDERIGSPSELELYEFTPIEYPITIRNYINKLCEYLGLTFANASDEFVNYDKEISNELFLSYDEATQEYVSLDYTFRDVLDQLAEVTASTICINADDELEIRYINDTEDTIDEEYLKDINVNFGEKYGPVNSIVFSRSAESDSIFRKDDASIELNGLQEIKIKDNQILNENNRDDFLDGVFEQLNGFEYYVNDFSSTGICYYDLCDRYEVVVGENTYSCVMLNDEIEITQGLVENTHTDMPEDTETDYKKADKTDRRIRQAYIIVDKVNQEINSVVETTNEIQNLVNQAGEDVEALGTRLTQTTESITAQITAIEEQTSEGANSVKTTSVTVDNNGITVATDTSEITTVMNNEEFKITSGDDTLAWFGYDDTTNETKAEMNNLTVDKYLITGYHRIEKYENNGEHHTGFFYIGGD